MIESIAYGDDDFFRGAHSLVTLSKLLTRVDDTLIPAIQAHIEDIWIRHQRYPDPWKVLVLATLGDNRVYDEIMAMIDEDTYRMEALRVTGNMKELRAIPALLQALESDKVNEVTAAAHSLATLGHPAAVPALDALLTSGKWTHVLNVTETIEAALKKIGTPDAIEALVSWQEQQS